jgi:seryl-tRNA synthetase
MKQDLDKLRERKNELSAMTPKNSIPSPEVITEAKEVKTSIQDLEKEYEETETEFLALYKKIPNIPSLDTPV